MRIVFLAATLMLLSGCGSVAPVVALDSENYMVGSHGVLGNGSAAEGRAKAVQAATDFCKAKSRAVQVDHIESVDPFFGRAPAADIRFRCVEKSGT